MNKNPDGSLLTADQLIDIAVDAGADRADLLSTLASIHGGASVKSHLMWITRDARLALMWDGKLLLDTRNTWVPSPPKGDIDLDVFNFLTRT
jgi:hypothetical protein